LLNNFCIHKMWTNCRQLDEALDELILSIVTVH